MAIPVFFILLILRVAWFILSVLIVGVIVVVLVLKTSQSAEALLCLTFMKLDESMSWWILRVLRRL